MNAVRASGVATLTAGALTALFWFLHPDTSLADFSQRLGWRWTFAYSMFLLILLLMTGLIGLYAWSRRESGKSGATGFLLAFVGNALFIGPGVFDGFVTPALVTQAPWLLEMTSDLSQSVFPLFALGGAIFAIGYILIGATIIRKRIFPAWIGVALILSAPVLGMSPLMPALLRTAGSVVFGVANIALGLRVWKETASGKASKKNKFH